MTTTRTDHVYFALIAILIGATLFPLIVSGQPYYFYSPDVTYVAAKVAWIERGHFFEDPISGTPTFHPITFHLMLSVFTRAGLEIKTLLLFVTLFVFSTTISLSYLVLKNWFRSISALVAVLLFPLLIQFVVMADILLPTAWNFSVPFYLAGLWLYLKTRTTKNIIATGLLWGLAFAISPVNLFLLAAHLVWDIYKHRDRYSLSLIAACAVTALPVNVIQFISVTRDIGFYRQETFSLVPRFADLPQLPSNFLRLYDRDITDPLSIGYIGLLLVFIALSILRKRIHWYFVLVMIVGLLTYLHFQAHYLLRIQMFATLFIAAVVAEEVIRSSWGRRIGLLALAGAVIVGGILQYRQFKEVRLFDDTSEIFVAAGKNMLDALATCTKPGDFVLCDRDLYRILILPNMRLRGLSVHKTLTYFQVKKEVADQMEADYVAIMLSGDTMAQREILARYPISAAIIWNQGDLMTAPLLDYLRNNWQVAYADGRFGIMVP